jgi:uncharacterized protein YbbC (DUF1343 family)
VPASFVNLAPGPLVHGLTMGEMARYVNSGLAKPARLKVVAMKGWRRNMTWVDTGLTWVPPSPNLRSPAAALAYPGVGLLEATNVSEGRGTETPFLVLGAPWLDPSEVKVSAPGFALEPEHFTPSSSPAAPQPKYLDEQCRGLTVRVTNAAAAEPYRLGVNLLTTLQNLPGFEWRLDGAALTRMVGTPKLIDALRGGRTAEQILAADQEDHQAWRRERKPALLY